MRSFPKDCPKECKYLKSWDLSIDDWTHVCEKLHIQTDDYDCLSPFCPLCPLSEDELKEAVKY